jgi:hypothetical protein
MYIAKLNTKSHKGYKKIEQRLEEVFALLLGFGLSAILKGMPPFQDSSLFLNKG